MGAKRPQPPSEPTIRRVLQKIDVEGVDTKIGQWIIEKIPSTLKAIAVDGKTLRGARKAGEKAPHLLSAVLHQEGLVVAQMAIGEKTNEIPKVKELLDPIALQETVVTADALHTRKDTARFLAEKKGAGYLFIVRKNQPSLHQDIEHLHMEAFLPLSNQQRKSATVDLKPGRSEPALNSTTISTSPTSDRSSA